MRTFAFRSSCFLECVCATDERGGFASGFPVSSFVPADAGNSGGSAVENLSRRWQFIFPYDDQVNGDGCEKTIPCDV